jgi:short-subunit dehydrogenase
MRLMKNAAAPRIINVSSQAHFQADFDIRNLQGEKSYNGVDMYCASKLCNLLFTYQLAVKLQQQSITVNAVHPGLVATDLYLDLFTEFDGELPQDAAETIVFMASSSEVEIVTGEYFMSGIPIQSSYNSYIKKYQRQLWEMSERLTGIESSQYIGTLKTAKKAKKRLRQLFHNLLKAANRIIKNREGYEYNVD